MSSSPLIFVRDGRTLPYFPVTHNALAAIEAAATAREDEPVRLAAARSLYLALLELANRDRSARVPASRRRLGELAGISRDLVSDVRLVLERAQVVRVVERFHENQQLEHEWLLCEPPESAEELPESRHPLAEIRDPLAVSHDPLGALPHRLEEGEEELQEEDSLRSSSAREVERELFDYWREKTNHPQAKLTDDRRRKLRARLREGYTSEQIRSAIDGAAQAPYINDVGRRFDDLELICRNGSKLEGFMARAAAAPGAFNVKPPGETGSSTERLMAAYEQRNAQLDDPQRRRLGLI